MKVVIQRVIEASVSVNDSIISQIGKGLLVFVGIEAADNQDDISWLVNKILNLRVFSDDQGVMNKSILDCNGDLLVVSQFTLHARVKKGNRPSYVDAAPPQISIPIYEQFVASLEMELRKRVYTGVFGADMKVALVNEGPVTILMDSKNKL